MADPVAFFTPEQARELWQDYQSRKQLHPQLQHNHPRRRDVDEPSPHRVFVKNVSGSDIPAYACMQVTGTTVEADRVLVTVTQPNTICGEYFFNSQFRIEAGGYGWGYAWGLVKMRGVALGYESCKRYTAVANSWSVAEGPGSFLVYGNDTEQPGVVMGRIVGDHCKARWIKFDYTIGGENNTVVPIDFFDGPDPSECGDVEVEYPCGEPLCDTPVMAFFDPNKGSYQAVTTPSAMMGEPQPFDIVRTIANDDCGIEVGKTQYRMFPNSCNPTLNLATVTLGAEVGVVLTLSSDSCGTINYAYSTIRAFLCEYPVEFDSFPINFDGVEFVTAASFGPPSCSGEATYRIGINVGLSTWELVTPCESGCESEPPPLPDPIPTAETFETVSCSSSANRQCGLNLQMGTICQDTGSGAPLPTIVHVPLPLEELIVSGEIYDNGTDAIVIERWKIYVCNFEQQPDDEIAIGTCITSSSGGS